MNGPCSGPYRLMTKRIDELSIFGEYGQAENRLTVALLQILKVGAEPLIRHFAEGLGFDIPSNEIDIFSQVAARNCTPDGLLESRFSFSLVIESKVKLNAVNQKQLDALLDDCSRRGPSTTLLYLTPDEAIPKILKGKECKWANWIKVRDVLQSFLVKPEIDNRELLEFLIDQFDTFASNLDVLEQGWDPDSGAVLVVPARNARGMAQRYSVYVCQNRRSFKPCGWIAFYANGQIDTIAEIASPPEDDVILTERSDLSDLAQHHPNRTKPCHLVQLKNIRAIGPIKNDMLDKNGNIAAWVQNQRYTTIDKIEKAAVTSGL